MSYGFGKTSFVAPATDAFGRLRVSNPVTQFEGKFTYGNEDKLFKTTVASGGALSFLPDEAAYSLTTGTTNGGRSLRESWRYFHYHTGKSQEIILTGVFGAAGVNTTKRIGYYDDNDGLFFVQNGLTGFGVCRRTSTSGSPVDNIVYQSSWNLDKMDGTGPSGITLDLTKTQIFFIDFQWLGVGSVRFGVDIGGVLYYVHQMDHANSLTQVYMKSAWLPIRYEIVNTGTAGATNTLKQICSTVMSEGGIEDIGIQYATTDLATKNCATGTWLPLLTLQVGTTLNGLPFRGLIKLDALTGLNTTANQSGAFAIFEGATLTGASYAAVGGASACNVDTTATAMSGGTQRNTVYVPISAAINDDLSGYFIMNSGMTYTIAGRGITGTCALAATLTWNEIV